VTIISFRVEGQAATAVPKAPAGLVQSLGAVQPDVVKQVVVQPKQLATRATFRCHNRKAPTTSRINTGSLPCFTDPTEGTVTGVPTGQRTTGEYG
jgi:hypothetical protein